MKESNVSNLTRTLAVLTLLVPTGAYPLGIGEIKLHSALNQNLDAEISLVLSAGERISDVKVSLASPDKFDERGVPWSYFLSNITFEPSMRSDGSAVIKVRSREVLKEPFLGLLLQVSWPKGTIYREFSLLVDPPAAYAQPIAPVTRIPEAISSAPSVLTPVPNEALTLTPNFVPESHSVASKPKIRPDRQDAIMKGIYGPVRRNESLWGIAQKASRHYKVTTEQMMVAIYKENPGAFYKDNVNALLARVKIKIPGRDTVIKLSHEEALAEFNRQTEAWKNRAQPVTAQAPKPNDMDIGKATQTEKPLENQLTLAAPAEATVAENAVITPGQEKGTSVKEKTATSASANEEMQQRVAALEEQLAKMQTLLTLKEQQLAAMQNQAQRAHESEQHLPVQSKPTVEPQLRQTASEQAANINPAPDKPVGGATKPTFKSAPKIEEESFPSGIIGGIGGIVLSLLGFFWWRKRNLIRAEVLNTESTFAPSIIYKTPEPDAGLVKPSVKDNYAYNVKSVDESSFLSEFTPSDFDAFDTDEGEIDPISEADVYLAYGRYQQAEELMRNEIESQPENDECKLKLLEIYYAQENKTAFEAYAKELMSVGKHKLLGFWEKVIEMGGEICPDSFLFSPGSTDDAAKDKKIDDTQKVSFHKNEGSSVDAFAMQFDPGVDLVSHDPSCAGQIKPSHSGDIDNFADFDVSNFAEGNIEANNEEVESETLKNAVIDFNLNLVPDIEVKNPQDSDVLSSSQFSLAGMPSGAEHIAAYPDDIDFDFDFSAIEAEPEEEEFGLYGVSDLTDMDELETKLDLARAYLDMGDNDSAKDIVNEVLENGTAIQKKQAQALIGDPM